jgi:mannose-6-phosphate isomerase-like protein (cupin superfamily)
MTTTRDQGQARFLTLAGVPLLESGNSMHLLARSDRLWLHAKLYADGGENGLHGHPDEDHAFLILSGAATFTLGDGSTRTVGAFEGLMLPRGAQYKFQSTGEGNLVMVRIGTGDTTGEDPDVEYPAVMGRRTGVQPGSQDNKTGALPAKEKPGAFFQDRAR